MGVVRNGGFVGLGRQRAPEWISGELPCMVVGVTFICIVFGAFSLGFFCVYRLSSVFFLFQIVFEVFCLVSKKVRYVPLVGVGIVFEVFSLVSKKVRNV